MHGEVGGLLTPCVGEEELVENLIASRERPHWGRNLLYAAYFYLCVARNLAKSGKCFKILLDAVECDQATKVSDASSEYQGVCVPQTHPTCAPSSAQRRP